MNVKKVSSSVAILLVLAAYVAVGQPPKLPPPVAEEPDDSPPSLLKLSLEFVGAAEVDFRGTERIFQRDGDGKLVGRVVPKWQADLPVRIKFEKLVGKELKLTSRDYSIALLNDKGEVVERELRLAFPHESDPKTGLPGKKVVRTIVVSDKPVVDDPKLSLWRGADGLDRDGFQRFLAVKPGRYTLVVAIHGQVATASFKVIGD